MLVTLGGFATTGYGHTPSGQPMHAPAHGKVMLILKLGGYLRGIAGEGNNRDIFTLSILTLPQSIFQRRKSASWQVGVRCRSHAGDSGPAVLQNSTVVTPIFPSFSSAPVLSTGLQEQQAALGASGL